MATFTWQVVPSALENSGGMSNIIKKLSLNLICDDGEIRRIKSTSAELNVPNQSSFIEYNQLTEQQVLNWGLSHLGEEQIQSMQNTLLQEIEMVKNSSANSGYQSQQIIPPWVTIG